MSINDDKSCSGAIKIAKSHLPNKKKIKSNHLNISNGSNNKKMVANITKTKLWYDQDIKVLYYQKHV